MNILVVFSTPTRRALQTPYIDTEDDTADSAAQIAEVLSAKLVAIDEDHLDKILTLKADVLFNLIEWTGLDLGLADSAFALLEKTGIPVTGATRQNYIMTSDKALMKKALDQHKLPTARWQLFTTGEEKVRDDFDYPVIIKPSLEHCSIGLDHESIVKDKKTLSVRVKDKISVFHEQMVVEEFIEGREFQVTALETAAGVLVLPPAEVVFTNPDSNHLLTFESRWDSETTDYKSSHVAISELSPRLQQGITNVTQHAFKKLGMRDYARMDIRTRGDNVFILEANSNPGLSDDMEYGMTLSYKAIGWTFKDFLEKIISSALRRG